MLKPFSSKSVLDKTHPRIIFEDAAGGKFEQPFSMGHNFSIKVFRRFISNFRKKISTKCFVSNPPIKKIHFVQLPRRFEQRGFYDSKFLQLS